MACDTASARDETRRDETPGLTWIVSQVGLTVFMDMKHSPAIWVRVSRDGRSRGTDSWRSPEDPRSIGGERRRVLGGVPSGNARLAPAWLQERVCGSSEASHEVALFEKPRTPCSGAGGSTGCTTDTAASSFLARARRAKAQLPTVRSRLVGMLACAIGAVVASVRRPPGRGEPAGACGLSRRGEARRSAGRLDRYRPLPCANDRQLRPPGAARGISGCGR